MTTVRQLLAEAQERRALAESTVNLAFAKLLIRQAEELERRAAELEIAPGDEAGGRPSDGLMTQPPSSGGTV